MRTVLLLFAAVLSLSTALRAQNFWQQVGTPYNGDVRSMTFTDSGIMIGGLYGGGVWRSTNDGQSWSISNNGIAGYYAYGLATSPNGNVFAAVSSGAYRSSNEGVNWEQVTVSSGEFRCLAISKAAQSSGTIFAGSTSGVTRSTDNGASWSSFQISNVAPVLALAVDPNGIVYAASTSYGIYRSTDNGASWQQTSLLLGTFASLAINSAGHVFAATYANVHRTLDSGASWQQVVIASADVKSVTVAPNGHIFAALNTAGVYRSTNNGTIWDSINTGLTNRYGALIAVNPVGYVFSVAGASLFRSSGPATGIDPPYSSLPSSPALQQNYPNPFNPSTTIKFDVPRTSPVRLKVFNALGQEVAILANETKSAGQHMVTFDARDGRGIPLPGGVYFARLQVADFLGTIKMIFVK